MNLFPSFKESSNFIQVVKFFFSSLTFFFCRFNGLRVFMALFLFMFYTITMSYRGSLKSVLTVTLLPKPIESIKELALKVQEEVKMHKLFVNIFYLFNFHSQNMLVGSFSNTFKKVADSSENPEMMKIAERFFTHYDFVTAFQNASEGKIVMGESGRFLEYNQRKKFTNE